MRRSSASLALKKFRGDLVWSVVIVAILTTGLTLSIVVPSAGATLQEVVNSYANSVGTYLNIAPTGFSLGGSSHQLLPSSIVSEVGATEGVQQVYPLVTNYTSTTYYNVTIGGSTLKSLQVSTLSALVGERQGFPTSLIQLVQGRLPNPGEAEFAIFSDTPHDSLNLNKSMQMEIAGISFSATLVGIAAANPPITGSIGILLDSSFVAKLLGPVLFSYTFGGPGFNYVIVKIASLNQVDVVSTSIESLLKSYSVFQPNYDQSAVINLRALVSQTAPFYEALGILSLGITSVITAFVVWLGVRRRVWETGMLVTQGWSWASVTRFLLIYYLTAGALSFVLAFLASLFLSPLLGFSLNLYGQVVELHTAPQPFYVGLSAAVAVSFTTFISVLIPILLRRRGLDAILRDY